MRSPPIMGDMGRIASTNGLKKTINRRAARTLPWTTPMSILNFAVSPKFVRTRAKVSSSWSATIRHSLPCIPASHSLYRIPGLECQCRQGVGFGLCACNSLVVSAVSL